MEELRIEKIEAYSNIYNGGMAITWSNGSENGVYSVWFEDGKIHGYLGNNKPDFLKKLLASMVNNITECL